MWRFIVKTAKTPAFGSEAIYYVDRLAPEQAQAQAERHADRLARETGLQCAVTEVDSPFVPDAICYRAPGAR